ncbi:carbon-nitrogen hydrolase family protein [Romeria aff. gracilis LEGE 07310]|uniref:Carbon-nitrogen hydrolase family protein n=1 Tax=Vasconcelosia minhoensis LEGE 07310 TaxID=915328 RepID=A0A8J7DR50_9CYAN|nr:carbon-nitrogen hydrolase family protein [Romeria gracilis]MBE9077779.1 carbon-nitrogen hydrolase family protein [Romeria aff. gracilis LEGE 07310]
MVKPQFRASIVQTLAALGDLQHNIRLLEKYTSQAVQQGAELIVFPECMNTGYLFDSPEHCLELAESLQGEFVKAMARLCQKHGIYLASGFTEKSATDAKVYNSAILLDRSGNLILHYQKQFLATHDHNWFECGTKGCPVVETDLGRIGAMICFDGRIPEIVRCLKLNGADVILDMANFFAMDQAELWVPARALENQVWIVAATKSGVERSIYYPGGSMIVAPTGQVMAKIPYDTHDVALADIFISQVPEPGLICDRRPDTYAILEKPFEDTPLAPLLAAPLVPERSTVKVAAVQAHRTSESGSLEAAFEMISHAAKLGIQLLALPLYFGLDTWSPTVAEAKAAAAQAAMLIEQGQNIAKQYGCLMVLPLIEQISSVLASSAVLIGPDGSIMGSYQQVHLDAATRAWASPGNNLPVFETPWGRIGIILGYDGWFPESTRVLTLKGADIIVWSSAWRQAEERTLLTVPKAEDNRVYLVCANRTDCPYPGGSFVVPPDGFPSWNLDIAAPPVTRQGAVMPMFANLALSRQKLMIPKVDLVRNRPIAQ